MTLNPHSMLGIHVLAHVRSALGENALCQALLSDWLESRGDEGKHYFHLYFHLIMCTTAQEHFAPALELYDSQIRPAINTCHNPQLLIDAVNILWRWELYGLSRDIKRWNEIRVLAVQAMGQDRSITMLDSCLAVAFAASSDEAALQRLLESQERAAVEGNLLMSQVQLPLMRGMAAFATGSYKEAIRQLEPIRDQVEQPGGSIFQRRMFEETLLEAYVRTHHARRCHR